MCDLIDLNSPDPNKGLRKELASPLIPPPAGSGSEEPTLVENGLPNLMSGEKRSSLGNNPFDQVFKETAEYVRKQEDPFEIVLENVPNCKKTKRHSVEFKDDFVPKQTRHAEVLKMNKTFDDSAFDINLNKTDLLNENSKDEGVPIFSIHTASPVNTSLLNYSAMNDSLTGEESNAVAEETLLRSIVAKRVSICIQKGIKEAESTLHLNKSSKLINGRSFSYSERLSPKKFEFRQRSHSIMDTKRKLPRSERSTLFSMPSCEFDDQMNKAFHLEQSSVDSSVFYDLSDISEITRLASVSSLYNSSSSLFSNGIMNQAFLRIGSLSSSQNFPAITSSPANTQNSFRSSSASSFNASEIAGSDISDLRERFKALKVKGDIAQLSEKFNELKCTSESRISEVKSEIESEGGKEEQEDKKDEKLIDYEVYVPSSKSASLESKSSFTNSSSDSVFTKSEVDKSILSEARKLAQTFEEMSEDKANSSGFDLLSNHTRFDFDQLPDSDDEVIVDNLIDLPPSPSKPETPPNSPLEVESQSSPADESSEEKSKIKMKEIEMEFIEPKDPEKKIMATSLLLELEKLIKTEKNPDAEKLLNELEKVLGVKWENNTELLETYLQNAKSNLQIDQIGKDEDDKNKDLENKDLENKNISKSDREDKENESIDVKEAEKEGLKRGNSFLVKKGRRDFRKMQYPGLNKSISRKSFDSSLKEKSSPEKSVHEDSAVSQVAIRNNSQSLNESIKSQILGVRKRFSSDPNFVNSILEKNQADSTRSMKKSISTKEVRDKVIPASEIQKNTISSMADAVRSKLKHKPDTGVSKRGPMKATIPFGSMQRRGSFRKKDNPISASKTPPKTSPEVPSGFTVTSSTPNSLCEPICFKKSKSKPVASSTPDHNKEQNAPIMKPPSHGNRNFSCNLSPVPALSKSSQEKLGSKDSANRNKINASPAKRPSTPKARRPPSTPSGIPKYSPKPEMQRRRSLNDLNKSLGRSELPQAATKFSSFQTTPISAKKVESEALKSPLRNINKVDSKAKPFNLISKMRRRENKYTESEKENYS